MDEKFDLEAALKTFTSYKKGQMFDGVVVIKRDDGVIFNIGGKNDAFIPDNDFEDFESLKIGDRFKVVITNQRNEEGFIEASKSLADSQLHATQNALKLKLGSTFSFVVIKAVADGLVSKMGEYEIFIPYNEISDAHIRDLKFYEGKQFDATVTEIDKDKQKIVGSIKLLKNQFKETNENLFWNSIFINKIVKGKIKKIMPYGCFVDVGGVTCFLHISNIAYERLNKPEDAVSEGQEFQFKVIELDRENRKVALSLKALIPSPKKMALESLEVGKEYKGEVIKLLQFGAIVKLENGATGLLHISNATDDKQKRIYEIVKNGDIINVKVQTIDLQEEKLSLALIQ